MVQKDPKKEALQVGVHMKDQIEGTFRGFLDDKFARI